MARTCRTARKSTGRLPIGQLTPRNVQQPQESLPDVSQEASPKEEPFEIELVVPESPTAQDSSAEEQQQPKDHDTEDKTNEEHPSPSDTESEKMYRSRSSRTSRTKLSRSPHSSLQSSKASALDHFAPITFMSIL
jgi:hypothetical protein